MDILIRLSLIPTELISKPNEFHNILYRLSQNPRNTAISWIQEMIKIIWVSFKMT